MPMLGGKTSGFKVPAMQAIIKVAAALTQNQWYDAWDGSAVAAGAGSVKKNVRLIAVSLDQAVANEDIEFRVIADSFDETVSITAVAGTNYLLRRYNVPDDAIMLYWVTDQLTDYSLAKLEARSLQLMIRKTTAAGANNTTHKIIYAQW